MNTRRRILEFAFDAFCRYGYQRVDMTWSAAQVGLSRQGLYKHFGSKEALFRAVVEDVHERTIRESAVAGEEADPSGPVAVFVALLESRFGWFLEHIYPTKHGRELLGESGRLCADLATEASERFADLLRAAVAREAERGRLILLDDLDARTLSDLLLGVANGLKAGDPSPSRAQYRTRLEAATRLMCASLLPAPHGQSEAAPVGVGRG